MKRHKLEKQLNNLKTAYARFKRDRAIKCADYLGIYVDPATPPIVKLHVEDHSALFEIVYQYVDDYYSNELKKLEEYLFEEESEEEINNIKKLRIPSSA